MLNSITLKKAVKYLIYICSLYLILKFIIKGECANKILLVTTVATCVFVVLDIVCPLINICKCSNIKSEFKHT